VGSLYETWGLIQPDNTSGGVNNADCAVLASDGTWADRGCALAHPYICEP
jgi:hypothetical protein